MKHEQLYFSEYKRFLHPIQNASLLLPFYATHSEARKNFIEKMKEGKSSSFVLYHKKKPAVFVTIEKNVVTNVLVNKKINVHSQNILTEVEKLVKSNFQKNMYYYFQSSLPLPFAEQFKQMGYTLEDKKSISKQLTYKTALVLGGGGAHGAYQIGVWQALEELEISFEMIIGTSVGALNGALIRQNDLEAAKKMWQKIETNQILSFSIEDNTEQSLNRMLNQTGAFTWQAIQSKGISTKPLQQLIQKTFSEKDRKKRETRLYIVTTKVPQLEEVIIDNEHCEKSEWESWLLASASFFPAMAAAKINEQYYVDGGYRNNVPVDVALRSGATECIIVDIKGPGISKKVKIPEQVSTVNLQTPWAMGALLLFDGQRSLHNMHLGYYETLKSFGYYKGFWYTIDATYQEILDIQNKFFVFLENRYSIEVFNHSDTICKKLQKIYKSKVYLEIVGLVLLELVAKNLGVVASKLYTIEELVGEIERSTPKELPITDALGLISLPEWVKVYYEKYSFLSEKQQHQKILQLLAVNGKEKKQRILFLMDKLPTQTLQILMHEFIQQGVDE